MKNAIASREIYGVGPDGARRRLTVAVSAPVRADDGAGWLCRVAVVDLLRPTAEPGADSYEALARGLLRVRSELSALAAAGWQLFADPGEERPLEDADLAGAP
jgi:hypothetical protein